MKTIYEHIIADPEYLANIQYGKPRPGHAEGSVAAHLADLENNLATLVEQGLVEFESDRYWRLRVLIHVHDSFKAKAKRDSAILDPQSHASLARAYLSALTDDTDMLQITQFHDIGFAAFKKLRATGRFDEAKLMLGLSGIQDMDLFLLFAIIDACTPSKGRLMIRWFVEQVNFRFPNTRILSDHILPGPELSDSGAW
jgi:DNA-binding MarR family transcriptional regulator